MQININIWSLKTIFGRNRSNRTCFIQRFASFCMNYKFIIQKVIHVVNSSHECEIMII